MGLQGDSSGLASILTVADAVIQRVEMYNASLPVPLSRLNVGLLARALRNTRTGTSRGNFRTVCG